ncbi:thiamine diphosphokinase [Clostridium sp.]|uniref:thiamine diphosphokinase n=1 Tax=Clostridium sp. TaxID=1506 RepID=UPI0026DC069C|nr:thiamine diphosphokinase [Clostridium sp.]MDO5038164.1 thiamine diphosphokinase [Clostridium sp.]
MRAIIVTGGNEPSYELLNSYIKESDIIIGVDKGCNILKKYEIIPNMILGDFDSIDKAAIQYFKNRNVLIEKFNPEKDYTDTHLAYNKAKDIFNVDEMIMFGATGTRLDHTLGNIGLMINALNDNIKLEIVDENNKIFAVNKSTVIKREEGKVISFHALCDEVKNFNITGGKYKLKNYNMKTLEPRAICNEFLEGDIEISFDSGIVLVLYSKD